MKVLIILGLPLSGKTTHAKAVMDELDFPLVETGTFVYEEVEARGLKSTPENVKLVTGECKAKSDSFFTERAIEFIEDNYKDSKVVFLSGVKALSEVEFLKSRVGEGNIILISFHASVKTRHNRLLNADRQAESQKRGAKGVEDVAMVANVDRFNIRDTKELGYGLGKLMAIADYVINTEDKLWPYQEFGKTLSDFRQILIEVTK